MKKLIKYPLFFLGLLLIFIFLLFISSLFPSSIIEKNIKESSKILTEEGNLYQFFDWSHVVNNNYTDVLMINEAYSIDNKNPLYSCLSVRKNYNENITKNSLTDQNGDSVSLNNAEDYDPVGELAEFLDGNIDTSVTYARYWHGYLPILRTLLIFFNVSEIRIILLIIFVFLFIWLLKLIKNKIGLLESGIFAISLILYSYFLVSYSLESAPVFLVMMISSIILLKRIDKIKNLYLFIFITACITNYVDYLTVPLITLAIPLILYITYKQKESNDLQCKDFIKIIIKFSLIWLLGYGFTWFSKWIIYDLLYNENIINTAISQVIYRTENSVSYKTTKISEVIGSFVLNNIIYCVIIGNFCLFLFLLNMSKYKIKLQNKKDYFNMSLPILLIALMPIVWYIVLSNHTIIHTRFTYRHMLIFMLCILIAWKNMCVIEKKNK